MGQSNGKGDQKQASFIVLDPKSSLSRKMVADSKKQEAKKDYIQRMSVGGVPQHKLDHDEKCPHHYRMQSLPDSFQIRLSDAELSQIWSRSRRIDESIYGAILSIPVDMASIYQKAGYVQVPKQPSLIVKWSVIYEKQTCETECVFMEAVTYSLLHNAKIPGILECLGCMYIPLPPTLVVSGSKSPPRIASPSTSLAMLSKTGEPERITWEQQKTKRCYNLLIFMEKARFDLFNMHLMMHAELQKRDADQIRAMGRSSSEVSMEVSSSRRVSSRAKQMWLWTRNWLKQILDTLVAIHREGIAHLDLSLENIFLVQVPGTSFSTLPHTIKHNKDKKLPDIIIDFRKWTSSCLLAKIGDFGCSRQYQPKVVSQQHNSPENTESKAQKKLRQRWSGHYGKVVYMAPEVDNVFKYFDPELADVYSFGVILFRVLFCRPPWLDATEGTKLQARERLKEFLTCVAIDPPELKDIITGCLALESDRLTLENIIKMWPK